MKIIENILEQLCQKSKVLTLPQLKLALSMRNDGNSFQKIGDQFGLSKQTIFWVITEYMALLKKFESKKPELSFTEEEGISDDDPDLPVNSAFKIEKPHVTPPTATPSEKKSYRSLVLTIFILALVIFLFYIFFLRK